MYALIYLCPALFQELRGKRNMTTKLSQKVIRATLKIAISLASPDAGTLTTVLHLNPDK